MYYRLETPASSLCISTFCGGDRDLMLSARSTHLCPLHTHSHALSGFGNKMSVVMIKQTFTFYLESSPIIPFDGKLWIPFKIPWVIYTMCKIDKSNY